MSGPASHTPEPPKNPADVEIIERAVAFKGYFKVLVYHLRHRLFGGGWSGVMRREVFDRGDAVGVLLYDPRLDAVVLVEQFRIGTVGGDDPHWMVEIVAGIHDAGETTEDVARREALEEAGCIIRRIEPIGRFYPSPGACSERITLYCGEVDAGGVGGIHGLAAEHEDIRVFTLPALDAIAGLDQGKYNNAIMLIAIGWLGRNRDRIREMWNSPA